jgi:ABC-type nitrate/sulfonate/bicarbonate transport system permease component
MADLTLARPAGLGLGSVVSGEGLRRLLGVALVVGAYEAVAQGSANRLTPPVSVIGERIWFDVTSGTLWYNAQVTLFRGFTGLGIAIVAGIVIGILMARSRWVDAAVQPLLGATYPIPRLALYPLLILILGLGAASKISLVAMECVYPMTLAAYAGARSVSKDQQWLTRNIGASWWRTIRDVQIPAALPAILTGLRVSAPIMLVVIIVTEMLGESRGLGFMIQQSRSFFEPEGVMAVIVVLGVLGFVLDRLIVALTRVLVFWERKVQL